MKTKVLITGASGFVGRKILGSLTEESDLAISVLTRDTGKLNAFAGRCVDIYEGDITKPETLKRPLAGKEIIIHCAALMSNFDSEPKAKFYDVNALGTINLLESCDLRTMKQFLHISTVGVYGAGGRGAISEEAPYGKALSKYEWSKKESESAVLRYGKDRNMPFTILRPSYLYGNGMRYGWPDTIKAVKSGRMFIAGNGRTKIHLLNIDDLVKAVKLALRNKASINRIYNIAGPEVLEIGEVFGVIAGILGVRPPKNIPYMPVYLASLVLSLVPYGMKNKGLRLLTPHRVKVFSHDHLYNIDRARAELKYNPSVNARDGFRRMIAWCEEKGFV